jgi:hypothetical protein
MPAAVRDGLAPNWPDGLLVVGFGLDRGYRLADFDAQTAAAGLLLEHRFATWDLRPWRDDALFAVTVLRRSAEMPTF